MVEATQSISAEPILEQNANEEVKEQEAMYSCGNCRVLLFKESDVLEHTSGVKKIKTNKNKEVLTQQLCSSIYLDLADWMNVPYDGETQAGKILCPNVTRCTHKLGTFAHYGSQCSCGKWVCPAYQIQAARVDKTFPKMDLTE